MSPMLIAATLGVPLAMLAMCLWPQARARMPALLPLAPLPALVAAMASDDAILVLPETMLGLAFALDMPARLLLGAAALLWAAAAVHARFLMQDKPPDGRFAAWWLVTLAGNLGVFMAADLVGFYLFFTMVSLGAYGLVVHDETGPARRAATVYVAFALLGETFLIMGFVLLAAAAPESLLIRDAVAALPTSPWRDSALILLILGFGVKIGLVPLHVWMPLTYSAAPAPAAAVLSGAAVKAGVIGLTRFLPFDAGLPGWGETLAAVGLFSAFYGVAIGITQSNAKSVLAYSSVSQMGLIAAVLGMGLSAGNTAAPVAAAFYAVHHVLAKGGLFLVLDAVARTRPRNVWPVMLTVVMALGLAGLPLSGGALAKLAIKDPLGDGVVGALAVVSAIGSALLMCHFLRCFLLAASQDSTAPAPAGASLPWLVVAIASVVLPWLLYPAVMNASWREALAPKAFWEALWPILIGGLLVVLLRHFVRFLPRIPAGDILSLGHGAGRAAARLGAAVEKIDTHLSDWPVAGVLFLALSILLVGVMLPGP